MSNGQKLEKFNNNERILSGDFMRMQDFIAGERNLIVSALMAFVQKSGSVSTPLSAVVIDGLDLIVENPGSILVNPGVLVAWNTVTGGADDTGIVVVCDPGIQTIEQLTIAANTGGSPRCDVIECSIVKDDVLEGGVSRDIRNPSTGAFTPQNVDKVVHSKLQYRVRAGTPGSPPGYASGWLPIALAVLQPGATLSQVDFYDVRPLYREIGKAPVKSTASAQHMMNPLAGTAAFITGASPVTDSLIGGWAASEFDGQTFGGNLYRNSPISAAELGNFGTDDDTSITLTDRHTVRGSSFAPVANDTIILAAWIPDLGVSGQYLPRCVRYSEGNPSDTAAPSRRRPFGPNGILLAVANSQDSWSTLAGPKIATPLLLNASGIGGCLGNAYGIPLAYALVNRAGDTLETKTMGVAEGIIPQYGLQRVSNRTIAIETKFRFGGVSATSSTDTFVSFNDANFTLDVLAGDKIEFKVGPIRCKASAANGTLRVQIKEDLTGTPNTVNHDYSMPDANYHIISPSFVHTVSAGKTGKLAFDLQVAGITSGSVSMDASNADSNSNGVYCTYVHMRPL